MSYIKAIDVLLEGVSIKALSEMYYLFPRSIQRIILKIKREIQIKSVP